MKFSKIEKNKDEQRTYVAFRNKEYFFLNPFF